jgi:hypothetical protein
MSRLLLDLGGGRGSCVGGGSDRLGLPGTGVTARAATRRGISLEPLTRRNLASATSTRRPSNAPPSPHPSSDSGLRWVVRTIMLSTGLVVVRVRSSARGQSQPARCESSPAGCPQRGYPQGRWQRLIGGDGARTVCPRDDQTCRCCRGNSTSDIHQRKLCPSRVCHSEPTPNRLAGRHNLPRAERRRRASPSRPTRRRSVQRFWRCTHRGGAREDSLSRVH